MARRVGLPRRRAPGGELGSAARRGVPAPVRVLLKGGADVNARDGDGTTALHWASYVGDVPTVDVLLQAGANANAADDLGVTPLWTACSTGHAAVVEHLLKAGATPDTALQSGETPLMAAAKVGSADAVKALVAHGANVNAREVTHGQTALMWAAAERHPEVVRLLLDAGADVRARSNVHSEVVNVAVQIFTNSGVAAGRSAQVVDALAASRARGRRGAAPARGRARADAAKTGDAARGRAAAPAGGGGSGVDVVDESGIVEIKQGGYTPILFAAQKGDVESARLLIAKGADVNDVAPSGTSALVVATHSGNTALGAFLLDQGANPNLDGAGYTALHAAIIRRDVPLVNALVAHHADLEIPVTKATPARRNATDYMFGGPLIGTTAYWLAARFNEPDVMRILASAGAKTSVTAPDGTTVLMAAMGTPWPGAGFSIPPDPIEQERTALAAVNAAVAIGADVNAISKSGDTAVHVAITRGFDSIVQTLAKSGARLDMKNRRGQTPLALAEALGRDSTVELLQKIGAAE
ncbi:MAG TPA: ankyrin repeat domain-containing protein [Vicinamibacterales bacterium]|nr:ankyrin repeat domain-containing protein [Vicinamibacterales bacterium]